MSVLLHERLSRSSRRSASGAPREDERRPHIKKPLNAFMLYMRDERPKVVSQCKVKESATINQILGQRVSGEGGIKDVRKMKM